MNQFSSEFLLKHLIDTCNIDVLEFLKIDNGAIPDVIPQGVRFDRSTRVIFIQQPNPAVYCVYKNAAAVLSFLIGLFNDRRYCVYDYVHEQYEGHTLLHFAVMAEALECVRCLTTLTADDSLVNVATDDGVLPLAIALEKDNIEIFLVLLEGGANAFQGNPCPFQLLLEHGSPEMIDTALMWLAANETHTLTNWANIPIDGKMPGDYLESIGRGDIGERIRVYEREEEEEEEENEELRCQLCKSFDVRKCYGCAIWFCPTHMRTHRCRILRYCKDV